MSRKPPTPRKNSPLDLPPVPEATRFVGRSQNTQPPHLADWVGNLLGIEYDEIELDDHARSRARLFIERKNRLAVYLFDGLFVAEVKRLSCSNLMIIENEAYLTINLAIASPETIKSTVNLLQDNPPKNDDDLRAAQLLERFIKLQNSVAILEAFQYEKFLVQEILSGSPWGTALFAALASGLPNHPEMLSESQRQFLENGISSSTAIMVSQFFISLFASQELRHSYPALAQYSAAIIPAGLAVQNNNLMPWAQAVIQEWLELSERERGELLSLEVSERDTAAQWLIEAIEAYANQASIP